MKHTKKALALLMVLVVDGDGLRRRNRQDHH